MSGAIFYSVAQNLEITSPPILTGICPDVRRSTDNLLLTGSVFKPPPNSRRPEQPDRLLHRLPRCTGGFMLIFTFPI